MVDEHKRLQKCLKIKVEVFNGALFVLDELVLALLYMIVRFWSFVLAVMENI